MLIAALLALAGEAGAATFTCGADAVANTNNVLCASGTCNGSSVTVTVSIEVKQGGCDFDLGGRTLTFRRQFDMIGSGWIRVVNAGNITITDTGKLKARGDYVMPDGYIIGGGTISLTSAGSISHDGVLDVSGDGAGTIQLVAAGDVTFLNGAVVTGNGISTFSDLGARYADGGAVDVTAQGGSITVNAPISLSGNNQAAGGTLDLYAARTITINQLIDISGGGGGGGELNFDAGDDVVITRAINADSRIGGGGGGILSMYAGEDAPGDAIAGGKLQIDGASITARGSATDTFGGDGGSFDVVAAGLIRFAGAGMVIRLDAATNFDGSAGTLYVDSSDSNSARIGPTEGDLELGGIISARSGSTGGDGGGIELFAGRDLVVTADIDISGTSVGGDIAGDAGRAVLLSGAITAQALDQFGDGGNVEFTAGSASDDGQLGNLTVAKNVLAAGGTQSGTGQSLFFAGCGLTVSDLVKIDGHGGLAPSGIPGGSDIDLVSRRPMQLKNGAQFLAGPAGKITTMHPVGANPIVGTVTFDPARVDIPNDGAWYPSCAVCGDGILQEGEPCDKGPPPAGIGTCCNSDCTAFACPTVTATPTPTPTRTSTPTSVPTSGATTPTRTPAPGPTSTRTPTPTVSATPTVAVTPAQSATPTATVTPPAIGTPSPTPSATETPTLTVTVGAGTATPASPLPTTTPSSEPQRLADPARASAAAKCQAQVNKAGLGFVNARLKSLGTCVNGILKCVQTKPDDVACLAKAAKKCAGQAAKLDGAAAKLEASLSAKCGAGIDPQTLFSAAGLDYASLAASCVAGDETPLDNLRALGRCLVRQLACRADRLFELQQPRTSELLRVADAALPAGCRADHGGSGAGIGDPAIGKLIAGCATGVAKANGAFLGTLLKGIGVCVNKAITCVQVKPDDATCIAKARLACEKQLGKFATARGKLNSAIDKKCAALDFDASLRSPQGSNLAALEVGQGAFHALGDYEALLGSAHECAAGELMVLVAPRAQELFAVLAPSASSATIFCSP